MVVELVGEGMVVVVEDVVARGVLRVAMVV